MRRGGSLAMMGGPTGVKLDMNVNMQRMGWVSWRAWGPTVSLIPV